MFSNSFIEEQQLPNLTFVVGKDENVQPNSTKVEHDENNNNIKVNNNRKCSSRRSSYSSNRRQSISFIEDSILFVESQRISNVSSILNITKQESVVNGDDRILSDVSSIMNTKRRGSDAVSMDASALFVSAIQGPDDDEEDDQEVLEQNWLKKTTVNDETLYLTNDEFYYSALSSFETADGRGRDSIVGQTTIINDTNKEQGANGALVLDLHSNDNKSQIILEGEITTKISSDAKSLFSKEEKKNVKTTTVDYPSPCSEFVCCL